MSKIYTFIYTFDQQKRKYLEFTNFLTNFSAKNNEQGDTYIPFTKLFMRITVKNYCMHASA